MCKRMVLVALVLFGLLAGSAMAAPQGGTREIDTEVRLELSPVEFASTDAYIVPVQTLEAAMVLRASSKLHAVLLAVCPWEPFVATYPAVYTASVSLETYDYRAAEYAWVAMPDIPALSPGLYRAYVIMTAQQAVVAFWDVLVQ